MQGMSALTPHTSAARALAAFLLVILILSAAGCAGIAQRTRAQSKGPDPAVVLAPALEAFRSGDYHTAAMLFERAVSENASEEMLRQSLYGLACTLLVTAETESDLAGALAIWDRWAAMPPGKHTGEDPRLLAPIVPRLGGDLYESQANLATRQKEIAKLKARLAQSQADMEELKRQLDALEKLHQEITIRKQGIN